MTEVLAIAPEYRFGGHQSFALRIAWLPKAVAAIEAGIDPLSDPIVGVVELGLGKNMVEALRCWIGAFGVAERGRGGWTLTPMGAAIFGTGGHDRFLEDVQTLWWLLPFVRGAVRAYGPRRDAARLGDAVSPSPPLRLRGCEPR